MPKRPFFALLIAGTALVLVLGFKTPVSPVGLTIPGSNVLNAARSGTYTGTDFQTPFGPVQVQVTLGNGRITAVQALHYPSSDPHSSAISQYAIPRLVQATLQAQSAQVDTVSGATFTSQAFMQSVQSALGQANG
jgi:uncharacterized protein with FMN-binding domain